MSKQANPTYYEVVRDILGLKMSASAKIVLLYIYDRQGGNKFAWPSLTTICRECNLSKGTVVTALDILTQRKLLRVKHPANPSRKEGDTNHYSVVLTGLKIEPVQKLDRSKNYTPTGLKIEPQPVQKLDPNGSLNGSLNDSYKKRGRKFTPPTLKEVQDYATEKKYDLDCKKFVDYYTESGWKDRDGKAVKNWKLKVITWSNRDGKRNYENDRRDFRKQTSNVGITIESGV